MQAVKKKKISIARPKDVSFKWNKITERKPFQ